MVHIKHGDERSKETNTVSPMDSEQDQTVKLSPQPH